MLRLLNTDSKYYFPPNHDTPLMDSARKQFSPSLLLVIKITWQMPACIHRNMCCICT